jgi:NADPH:quinone reductase-like Zn-dependent oxidoreductase
VDIYRRESRPPCDAPPLFVPGAEGAGTVAAVGLGVEDVVAVGDRVARPGCRAATSSRSSRVRVGSELGIQPRATRALVDCRPA